MWEQRFPHALGWNQPGQSCGQGEYKLKTPWVSCLLLTVQLESSPSSLLCPSACSDSGCWLHSLPSSNSSTRLRKQEETRAWITTWVTNSQHLVLLRAGGENSSPLCDSPSPVTLQKRLQTSPLCFQNCTPSCAAMLANSTWRVGETTSLWALWQCFISILAYPNIIFWWDMTLVHPKTQELEWSSSITVCSDLCFQQAPGHSYRTQMLAAVSLDGCNFLLEQYPCPIMMINKERQSRCIN